MPHFGIDKDYYLNSNLVKANQRAIHELCRASKDPIHILPRPLGGSVQHYYHFTFDLMLPFSMVLQNVSPEIKFSIRHIGPLTPILLKSFGDRIKIHTSDRFPQNVRKVKLVGLNPDELYPDQNDFSILTESIFRNLNIPKCSAPNKILLIQRGAPSQFYLKEAKLKGSGTSRRSIINHKEIEQLIRAKTKQSYEFHNLVLEETSFEDQIKHFNSAALVIGQHGAGLSNLIWMNKRMNVIEIGYRDKKHFEKISLAMKHNYFEFGNKEPHQIIDRTEFSNFLDQNETLSPFFNRLN